MRTGNFKQTYAQLVVLNDSPVTWIWVAILGALLLIAPILVHNYALTIMVSAMIAAVGAVGLNVLTGTTGLISLGQSGFLAVGAYTNAILMVDYGWPVLMSLPAAGVVSAFISILVGVPSLRLKGLYLAITTLAFAFIVNHTILHSNWLTHGADGMFVSGANILGINIQRGIPFYYFVLAVTVLIVLIALNLQRSRIGRAWMAIRDHDIAAGIMGINLVRYKLLAFMISSFMVGIAGGLISLQIRYINIDAFNLILSIEALAIIILGGLGSVAGPILGAVFLTFLPELIRVVLATFGDTSSTAYTTYVYEVRGIVYGIVIVLFLRFKPRGLIGLWKDQKKYWTNWPLSY